MWLNGNGTDLQKLGNSSSTTTGLVIPKGFTTLPSLRVSKPNSLDDSWTFSLHHVGEPTRRKRSLTGRKQQTISCLQICLYTWSCVNYFSKNTNKILEAQHSYSTVASVPLFVLSFLGREMAINTKGHQLMLSPAASPEACEAVPPRLSGRDGRPSERGLSRGRRSAHRCSCATLNLEMSNVCGFDCSWLRTLQLVALRSSHRCSTLFKMAACATIKVNTKLK